MKELPTSFYLGSMTEEFASDTIVRSKLTGTFGKIVKRCICGNSKMPVHYEVLVEGKTEEQYHVIDHSQGF